MDHPSTAAGSMYGSLLGKSSAASISYYNTGRRKKRGHKTNNESFVAVKAVPVLNTNQLSQIERDIDVMKHIRHPNIVTLREVIHDEGEDMMYLVMDYIPVVHITPQPWCPVAGQSVLAAISGQEMRKVSIRMGVRAPSTQSISQAESERETANETPVTIPCFCEPLPLATISSYLRQIVRGLHYLHHTCHILHRDLKPDNILVGRAHFGGKSGRGAQQSISPRLPDGADNKHRLFLADFGVSSSLGKHFERWSEPLLEGGAVERGSNGRSDVNFDLNNATFSRLGNSSRSPTVSRADVELLRGSIHAASSAKSGDVTFLSASNIGEEGSADNHCVPKGSAGSSLLGASICTTASEMIRMSNLERAQMQKNTHHSNGSEASGSDEPELSDGSSDPSAAFAESSDSGSTFSDSVPTTSSGSTPFAFVPQSPTLVANSPLRSPITPDGSNRDTTRMSFKQPPIV